MKLSIVILAAGQGTRMQSNTPKVLHQLADKSLLEHVYTSASAIPHEKLYIVHGANDKVEVQHPHLEADWVLQAQQFGTGHALSQVTPLIPDSHRVLVLYGDMPLITTDTLNALVKSNSSPMTLLTIQLPNPTGYGRVIRNSADEIIEIVEEKDTNNEQRAIKEVYTGILSIHADPLKIALGQLQNNNTQNEYYLTDIIRLIASEGGKIVTAYPQNNMETLGINTQRQLAQAERYYQLCQADRLMEQGAILRDPERFDLRGSLEIGENLVLDVNIVMEGHISLGDYVTIGPNCIIRNSTIGNNVIISANSIVDNASIGNHCSIGPFARIRPDTQLEENAQIGNFVEIKKSHIGAYTKINHLSYLGDSTVGKNTNIGAGVITCNYDGTSKHQTIIGDDAFIGSDVQLVAPVKVGANAAVAAGTTITKEVTADSLAISRVPQKIIPSWRKNKKSSAKTK